MFIQLLLMFVYPEKMLLMNLLQPFFSPSGKNKKELRNKYEIYEEAGVKEYWIVWPESQSFLKYTLNEEGKYIPSRILTSGDEVNMPILPGFVLNLEEVFEEASL